MAVMNVHPVGPLVVVTHKSVMVIILVLIVKIYIAVAMIVPMAVYNFPIDQGIAHFGLVAMRRGPIRN